MAGLSCARLTLVSVLVCILINVMESSPLVSRGLNHRQDDSEDEKFEIEYPSNVKEPADVKGTVKHILEELNHLQVKALYQKKVSFERLANETNIPSLSSLPKYVVTQEEKVYFFVQPSNNTSPILGVENDASKGETTSKSVPHVNNEEDSEEGVHAILERLIARTQQHDNNPSSGAARSLEKEKLNVMATLKKNSNQATELNMAVARGGPRQENAAQTLLSVARRHTGNPPGRRRYFFDNLWKRADATDYGMNREGVERAAGYEPSSQNAPNVGKLLALKILLEEYLASAGSNTDRK